MRRLLVRLVVAVTLANAAEVPVVYQQNINDFNISNGCVVLPKSPTRRFSRSDCLYTVQVAINATSRGLTVCPPWNQSWIVVNNSEQPVILNQLAYELCYGRDGPLYYPNLGARFLWWMLPIILMTFNFQFQQLGPIRFSLVGVLLGSPVLLYYSHCTILEIFHESRRVAEEVLQLHNESQQKPIDESRDEANDKALDEQHTTINELRDEANDESQDQENEESQDEANNKALDEQRVRQLTRAVALHQIHYETKDHDVLRNFGPVVTDWKDRIGKLEPATTLDKVLENFEELVSRKSDLRRSLVACIVYALTTLLAFVPRFNDGNNASGAMLGPPLLLTYFLPNVALSNVIGDYPAENTKKALNGLFKSLKVQDQSPMASRFEILYCCQFKMNPFSNRRRFFMLFLSAMTVLISFGAATRVLDTAPAFFSCNNKLILGITLVWIGASVISYVVASFAKYTGDALQWVYIIVNSIIGTGALVFIVLASAGWKNECDCMTVWSSPGVGSITLFPKKAWEENIHYIYPATVGACLGLELLIFLSTVIAYYYWATLKGVWADWLSTSSMRHQDCNHEQASSGMDRARATTSDHERA